MNFLRPKSIWNSMNEIVEEISFQVQFCEWRHAGRRSINARTQWTFFPGSLALTFNQRKPLCWIKASKVWSTRHPRPIVLLHRPYNFLYVLYKMTCQWLCMMLILILYSAKAKIGALHCAVCCAGEGEITDKETGPVQNLNRLDLAETETKPVGVSNYSAGAAQSTDHPKKGPWQYLVAGVMFRPLSVKLSIDII